MFGKLRRRVLRTAGTATAGAAWSYFYDPVNGPARRQRAKARTAQLSRAIPSRVKQAFGRSPEPKAPVVLAPVLAPDPRASVSSSVS